MKQFALLLFTTFGFLYANAQKLPTVQKVSVRAPQSIKIDGKATEWNDKYQAYNNATDVYYTLSNDDNNLYLVIKAEGTMAIGGRILGAGISFTVNHTLNKKEASAVTITYPILKGNDIGLVSELLYSAAGLKMGGNAGGGNTLTRLNKTFTEKSKYIGVTGIKNVTDNEIPLYNNLGIQTSSAFYERGIYVYELAIPLELLALPAAGTQAFSYHIKLNVRSRNSPVIINPNAPPEPQAAPEFITPTDFWGEYTLAK
uniref:Uncharacterized protein n=1 Tax=uncultured bacterium 4C6 TaxID=1701323 RepID=A0A0N9HM92_9BACT|nr:hypothetical protein [uncultured bacterium 4C6]